MARRRPFGGAASPAPAQIAGFEGASATSAPQPDSNDQAGRFGAEPGQAGIPAITPPVPEFTPKSRTAPPVRPALEPPAPPSPVPTASRAPSPFSAGAPTGGAPTFAGGGDGLPSLFQPIPSPDPSTLASPVPNSPAQGGAGLGSLGLGAGGGGDLLSNLGGDLGGNDLLGGEEELDPQLIAMLLQLLGEQGA